MYFWNTYILFIIILLGFYYLMSNKVMKISFIIFRIEVKRKKLFLLLIIGFIIFPLILTYSSINTRLVLTNDYVLIDDIVYREYILYGRDYSYTAKDDREYTRSDYGVVTELYKSGR